MDDILDSKDVINYFAGRKKSNRAFKVVQSKWSIIEESVKLLKLFFFTTKELQRINFTLSDFYGHLLALKENLKIFLESNNNPASNLATCLQLELNRRLPMLIKNPLMICAVFLDRRYSTELNTDEKALAIRTLVKIWADFRSDHANDKNSSNNDSSDDNNTEQNSASQFQKNATVLESYFNAKGVQLVQTNDVSNRIDGEPIYSTSNAEMIEILQSFDRKEGRQHVNKNIIDYWHERKAVHPEIYLISKVINAVPPTQASTERSFSALNFIFDKKRSKLSLTLLEQILLLRINKDLMLKIFAQDLNI